MQLLKLKTFLFLFLGMLLFVSHIILYREIVADCAYPFFSALLFLMFSSLWAGTGLLFSPFKKHDKPYILFPLLCFAPATLLSIIAVQLLCTNYTIENYSCLAIIILVSSFPQGIISGIILSSLKNSISDESRKQAALFLSLGYSAAGIILYPLALFNVLTNPVVYILAANALILFTIIAVFNSSRARALRYWFLILSTVIIALNFCLLNLQKYSLKNLFSVHFNEWHMVKPYSTHHGRIVLLKEKKANNNYQRFMLLRNNKVFQILPDDSKVYRTNAIPFSLLPGKNDLKVLAIGSPFSYVPSIFSTLPYVESVSHVTGENTLPVTVTRSFSLPPDPRVKMSDISACEFLKKNRNKFDLIIWLSPKREYLNLDRMIKLCASHLEKDGILALPASLLAANNTQNTWKTLFKNKISIPGRSLVYAFSNAELTSDLKILEKRLTELDERENKLFPPGVFSIIYSIPSKSPSVDISTNRNQTENSILKAFSNNIFDTKAVIVIILWTLFYFAGRFMVLRRKSLYSVAGFFENGLCTMLLLMTLMAVLARIEGDFYYNFGTMMISAGAIPLGLYLNRYKIQRLAVIMSIIVIFLCNIPFKDFSTYLIPVIAYINFLCGGIILADIFKKNQALNIKLLSFHFIGSVLAAIIMFILLVSNYSFYISLLIIILFRIPLVFSRTTLGKLDNPGGN